MLIRRVFPLLVLIAAFAAMAVGIVHLMRLRFETGDIYPHYSSLRADPLGAKILFESIDRLEGVEARRHFRPLSVLRSPQPATLLYLGLSPEAIAQADQARELEELARDGHRVVLTFRPIFSTNALPRSRARPIRTDTPDSRPPRSEPPRRIQKRPDPIDLRARWDFRFTLSPSAAVSDRTPVVFTAERAAEFDLPHTISWHTALRFQTAGNSWSVIYQCEGEPVLLERRFGQGAIVLSADSYFLSNEAMFRERHPDLLSWIIGANRHVVCDEAHFGIAENPGVAALARKYRLHGLAAGLLLLAALFVWKNVSPLVPVAADLELAPSDHLTGKDASSGFVNLLRRNISAAEVVFVGFEQWKHAMNQTPARSKLAGADSMVAAERERPPKERDPIRLYRSLAQHLSSKNKQL